jgi:hypothetical protein
MDRDRKRSSAHHFAAINYFRVGKRCNISPLARGWPSALAVWSRDASAWGRQRARGPDCQRRQPTTVAESVMGRAVQPQKSDAPSIWGKVGAGVMPLESVGPERPSWPMGFLDKVVAGFRLVDDRFGPLHHFPPPTCRVLRCGKREEKKSGPRDVSRVPFLAVVERSCIRDWQGALGWRTFPVGSPRAGALFLSRAAGLQPAEVQL